MRDDRHEMDAFGDGMLADFAFDGVSPVAADAIDLAAEWLRVSAPVWLDPETYVPQDAVPDEVITRRNADRGRPRPIPDRPSPVPEMDGEEIANDPALWTFRAEVRECAWCGAPFAARTANHRHCSVRCAARAEIVIRTCAACGKPFLTRHPEQQTCSTACNGTVRRNPANERRCRLCGRLYRATRPKQMFCSRSCAWAWRRMHRDA